MAFTNTIGGSADDSTIRVITLTRDPATGDITPDILYDRAGQKARHVFTPSADFKTKVEALYAEIKTELDDKEGVGE
jgi:hypothetical protein